jgi:hypothetical protein
MPTNSSLGTKSKETRTVSLHHQKPKLYQAHYPYLQFDEGKRQYTTILSPFRGAPTKTHNPPHIAVQKENVVYHTLVSSPTRGATCSRCHQSNPNTSSPPMGCSYSTFWYHCFPYLRAFVSDRPTLTDIKPLENLGLVHLLVARIPFVARKDRQCVDGWYTGDGALLGHGGLNPVVGVEGGVPRGRFFTAGFRAACWRHLVGPKLTESNERF